jgi:hypothetical protein
MTYSFPEKISYSAVVLNCHAKLGVVVLKSAPPFARVTRASHHNHQIVASCSSAGRLVTHVSPGRCFGEPAAKLITCCFALTLARLQLNV